MSASNSVLAVHARNHTIILLYQKYVWPNAEQYDDDS
jgi:hypothetical protein